MAMAEIRRGPPGGPELLVDRGPVNPDPLSNVFSFLNIPNVIASSRVCKSWRKIAATVIPVLSAATFENAEEIAKVVVAAFSRDIFRKVGQKRTSKEEVEQDMRDPRNIWYVFKSKAQIIGAMMLSSDSQEVITVHMLSARPDYWGQSLGIYLLRSADAIARKQGKKYLEVSAAHTNVRLIKSYERFGFKKKPDCVEEEYFPPNLQQEYLIPEYQGYESEGKAKLRNYDMAKPLEPIETVKQV